MGQAAEVYSKELNSLSLGCPLWFPEPTDSGEIQIGDVGFVRDGGFHRLFNITVSGDHGWNRLGVPEAFAPIDIPAHLRQRTPKYLGPGPHSSRSVRTLAVGPNITA